jgi:hypothetical protein
MNKLLCSSAEEANKRTYALLLKDGYKCNEYYIIYYDVFKGMTLN